MLTAVGLVRWVFGCLAGTLVGGLDVDCGLSSPQALFALYMLSHHALQKYKTTAKFLSIKALILLPPG